MDFTNFYVLVYNSQLSKNPGFLSFRREEMLGYEIDRTKEKDCYFNIKYQTHTVTGSINLQIDCDGLSKELREHRENHIERYLSMFMNRKIKVLIISVSETGAVEFEIK